MRGVTHTDRGRVKRSEHLSPCQVPHLVLDILSRTVHFVYLQEFPAFPQGWLIIICDVSCKEYLDIFGFFVCEPSSLWCSPRLLSRAALWWALAAWLWWALAPWLWWALAPWLWWAPSLPLSRWWVRARLRARGARRSSYRRILPCPPDSCLPVPQ